MRRHLAVVSFTALACLALAQQTTMPTEFGKEPPSNDSALKEMFQSKIKAEWEALKNKDKKALGDLLADDYEGVEVDGKGERTKVQALNELVYENVSNYTLFGFKMIPLGSNAAFLIYESTMQFPPKSQVRLSRVYITELWIKRSGQWKEVHYQETHVK
ncbi:MAG: nuclear transport factor 2 family protein [Candidatus Sulfotelmatobacter sp.]|jgi:hypothetical protein